jgi:hypothetical protein
MQLQKPAEAVFDSAHRNIDMNAEPVTIKAGLIAQIGTN